MQIAIVILTLNEVKEMNLGEGQQKSLHNPDILRGAQDDKQS